jgi:pre-peptidase
MRAKRSAALVLLLAAACGKSGTGPEPDLEAITQLGSTPASAPAGSTVAVSFLVRHGPSGAITAPKSGEVVTFTVVSGGGSVAGGTSTVVSTGADGVASVNWQLGTLAGTGTLRGSINGTQSVDVSVTATVTPPPSLSLLTPPSASPQSGIPFFQQPVVQLLDPNGAPLAQAGVSVTASVSSGAGTLGVAGFSPLDARWASAASLTVGTDASGQAKFSDLLLTGGGTITLQFGAPGYAPVTTTGLSVNGSPLVVALTNGNEVGPFGSAAGSQTYASFVVPAGTTDFRVGFYNGTGTVHLYARRGNYPTATVFDCASLLTGTSQLCSVSANPAGQWYLAANGVTAYQNALVRAVAYGPSCARQVLIIGTAANGTLNPASDCTVPAGQGARDRFSLAPLTQQTLAFNVTSSNSVGVDLKSATSSRHRIGNAPAGGVSIPYLIAPGDHDVELVDATVGFPGGQTYSLTATQVSPNLGSCAPVGMYETGVVAVLNLAATDCAEIIPGVKSDRFYTWALTGQTIVATMSSTAFDPFLSVLSGQALGLAPLLASDDNGGGGTTARVSYTNLGPPADFTIVARHSLAGGFGAYTLSFELTPAVYNLPQPAPAHRSP